MLFSRPRLIILLTLILVGGDILIVGPEVFTTESLGTWMLSPAIYASMLPSWLGHPLAIARHHHPVLDILFCAPPVLMLLGAGILGILAIRRNSLPPSLTAFALVTMVFTVYQLVQPMGFRVIG